MLQVIAFILGGLSVAFLFINAIFMISDGVNTDLQRFALGITGLILAAFFHKSK